MKTKLINIITIIGIVISTGYTLMNYVDMPQTIPTHWDFSGNVNGYGDKTTLLFLIALAVGGYFMFPLLKKIDPKAENYEKFGNAYEYMRCGITLFMCMVNIVITYTIVKGMPQSEFNSADIGKIVSASVGLMFMVLGNYMPKMKQNYFCGIKTPWTLANEDVWNKTHRLAGPIWVVGGLVIAVSSFIMIECSYIILFVALVPLTIYPYYYSYKEFKKIKKD